MPIPNADEIAIDTSPAPRRARMLGLGIALVFTVLDQVVKTAVEHVLVPGEFVPWLSRHIGWQLVYNPHGAFGVPAPPWLFLAVTVVVGVIVFQSLPRVPNRWQAVAFGLLLAGAMGNAIDRVFRAGAPGGGFGGGHVVDFVAWGTFPRFNVADAAITVGFICLAVSLWVDERRS
ncbi:MAG: signal peptidase II [Nitriliruptoraceae bacterium]